MFQPLADRSRSRPRSSAAPDQRRHLEMACPAPQATRRRKHLAAAGFLAVFVIALLSIPAHARESTTVLPYTQDLNRLGDLPARSGPMQRASGDTLYYGYYDGTTGLALSGYPRGGAGHTWTFDHGAPDPFEGWYATDLTANGAAFGRHVDAASWSMGGNSVPAPILAGLGSAWIGATEEEGDSLCWDDGLGYGDSWCQRLISPPIVYSGGGASLSLAYFNDTEVGYDYSRVLLVLPDGTETSLNGAGFDGQIGLASDHPASPPIGQTFVAPITHGDFGGFGTFQLVFEMDSDGGWSDQDGEYATDYGPFGVDDVALTGGATATYAFESSLDGWEAAVCQGFGTFFGVADVAQYTLLDPCGCGLSGNVLEMHDDSMEHPYGQRVALRSNPVDLTGALGQLNGSPSALSIGASWDQYADIPSANGVFYRSRWVYYPYLCPVTGQPKWSPPTSQGVFFINEEYYCGTKQANATENGVPNDIEQIRFYYEIFASCDAFGIDPTDCSGVTNFSPVIDNVNVFATGAFNRPEIAFGPGRQFQDGFNQRYTLSTIDPGNADCTANINGGNTEPIQLYDVPLVRGPSVGPNPWSATLHFRVVREGPGVGNSAFSDWQAWKAATGVGVGPNSPFALGVMDTAEVAGEPVPLKNEFEGYYREDDPNDPSPGTERTWADEIIIDNIPPGTKIEYFVSAKYHTETDVSLLPDTSGGHFAEFEILPSWRLVPEPFPRDRFPAVLYIPVEPGNASLGQSRFDVVETGLEVLFGPADVGDLRMWDRYDYLDGASNWKAPLARGPLSANNGVSPLQIMGYRYIVLELGQMNQAMWPDDFVLLSDWLTALVCSGNDDVQGLLISGDGAGTLLQNYGPGLLHNRMAASLVSSDYSEDSSSGGPDENFCVRIESATGSLFGTSNPATGPYEYSAWGNGCPTEFSFDVLAPSGAGVGNRSYVNTGNLDQTNYAQVVHDDTGAGTANYRTVLSGVSSKHLSLRSGVPNDPGLECQTDSASVFGAVYAELASAAEWILGLDDLPGLTFDQCGVVDVPDDSSIAGVGVSRLVANTPNPFNPRTTVRFALASGGKTAVRIYDTSGRLVRTLVDAELVAGPHRVTWDGADDHGHRLPAGVYWSQLSAPDGYTSSKRMVIIR